LPPDTIPERKRAGLAAGPDGAPGGYPPAGWPPRGRSFGPLTTIDGRLVWLDVARGLAVLFMVCQHVQIMFAADAGEGSAVGELFLLLGTAPAAPVFMVAMGFLFGSRRATRVMQGVLRGAGLFALGYALNLARFTLPMLVAEASDSQAGAGAVDAALGGPLEALLLVDILQLAGLSLIVMALCRPLLRDPRLVVALALVVFTVAPLLWGVDGDLTAPLWGEGDAVAFPLFPWLGYPLLGLAFAEVAQRSHDERRLMLRTCLVAVFTLVAGGVLVLVAPATGTILGIGDYFHSGLPVHLAIVGFVFLWLPVLWWLTRTVPRTIARRYLTSLSRHLTPVYVIQWILIGWLAIVFGVVGLEPAVAAALAVPILIASHLLAIAWDRGRRRVVPRRVQAPGAAEAADA